MKYFNYKLALLINFFLIFSFAFSDEANLTGLPHDINNSNYALLFTMTDEQGRTRNLQLMEDSFIDGKFGFKCHKFHNVPSSEIYERIKEYTTLVGEDGTLLIYVNSHGGGSGKSFSMTARNGNFKFSKAIESISKSGKVKRLIVLIDTCHAAGGIEEGFNKKGEPLRVYNIEVRMPEITKNSFFRNFFDLKNNDINYCLELGAFDEVLILASSSPEKLTTRGIFAAAWNKTKNESPQDVTVVDFLKAFAKNGLQKGQQPYFKCLPNNSIFNEPIFENPIPRELPVNGKKNNLIILPDFKIK
jgi:hypothetical protein